MICKMGKEIHQSYKRKIHMVGLIMNFLAKTLNLVAQAHK